MKLDVGNLKVLQKKEQFVLQILMPDGSKNYLHSDLIHDINDAVKLRDELMGIVICSENILIINVEAYFRIDVILRNDQTTKLYSFHSRKLNVTDVVFEREQLLL
ncbi:MAG: hypothetical protein IIC67_09560 [Thaumarchaeota archaeon]|nr:hypothetical protein [Nitrososphaerota archaeon]